MLRPFLSLCLLGCLAGCSSIQANLSAVRNYNGLFIEVEEKPLSNHRYWLRMTGSAMMYGGEVEQFFQRRLREIVAEKECIQFDIQTQQSGVENTLIGGRRFMEIVVRCEPNELATANRTKPPVSLPSAQDAPPPVRPAYTPPSAPARLAPEPAPHVAPRVKPLGTPSSPYFDDEHAPAASTPDPKLTSPYFD